jgi:molybdopterin/thiamine biosynthesis adenylyltransferase
MKESVVLIMTLTPTCTELARHLALSGINLLLLKDESTVSEEDTQSDFLFAPSDIGNQVSFFN